MKTIIENGITFAYLSINDVEAIEAMVRKGNTDALNAQLDAIKDLTPQARLQLWTQARPDQVSVNDLYRFVSTTREGIVATLQLAAKKAGSVGTLDIDIVNAGNLAAHLIGLEHRTPFVAEDKTKRPTTAE